MIGAILLALVGAATPQPDCAAARAAVPGAGACVASRIGVALAADQAAARDLLSQAQVAEQRFRDRFGREPAPYAVFSFEDSQTPRTAIPALRKLGFRALLPVESPALKERKMAELMSRFQPLAKGGPPPRFVRNGGPGGGEPQDENLIPHELGHQWYSAAFWSGSSAPSTPSYGSPGPDWLDEAAAISMENEAGARRYHQKFADGRSADASRAANVPPEMTLAQFTSMTHPAMVNMPMTSGQAGGPMMVRSRPTLFYPQARAFADYLAERSGQPGILAVISEGLRVGTTFEAWLASHGAKHKLPTSLAAMQADWDRWLDRRFGPAPSDR